MKYNIGDRVIIKINNDNYLDSLGTLYYPSRILCRDLDAYAVLSPMGTKISRTTIIVWTTLKRDYISNIESYMGNPFAWAEDIQILKLI